MTAIHVSVTAADIAAARPLPRFVAWSAPIEAALGRLTGQVVDVDGDSQRGNIATIGQGNWTLVVDLPEPANDFLAYRWEQDGDPFDFDIEIEEWLVSLIAGAAAS